MADQTTAASPAGATLPTSSVKDESTGNWWDSWLTSAKSKSAEVYSMVKKDLDEIGSAVKSEASELFTTTSTAIGKTLKLDEPESPANVMKKSFSTFIGQVSTVLNPEPDDEDDTEVILSSGDTTMLSTYKKELEALQRVDATFIVPADSSEFDAWRSSLELTEENRVISQASAARRLGASATLRAQYERLVPDAVNEEDFWERYLFRVALLQDRLAAASRKQPPTQQADPVLANLPLQCTPEISPKKESPIVEVEHEHEIEIEKPEIENPQVDNIVAWEDEDFAHDVELTEEQQILLLEEYEKEIASKKLTKQSPKDKSNNNANRNKTGKKETIDKLNNKAKKTRSPKKSKDVCGNELVEDYFGENPVKDDASANSDESWEKEFEIDDVTDKA